jgi:hypothetical protein
MHKHADRKEAVANRLFDLEAWLESTNDTVHQLHVSYDFIDHNDMSYSRRRSHVARWLEDLRSSKAELQNQIEDIIRLFDDELKALDEEFGT